MLFFEICLLNFGCLSNSLKHLDLKLKVIIEVIIKKGAKNVELGSIVAPMANVRLSSSSASLIAMLLLFLTLLRT